MKNKHLEDKIDYVETKFSSDNSPNKSAVIRYKCISENLEPYFFKGEIYRRVHKGHGGEFCLLDEKGHWHGTNVEFRGEYFKGIKVDID